ncbi:hypothetical protein WA158_004263 [Blastocystis sp. Blastoise]
MSWKNCAGAVELLHSVCDRKKRWIFVTGSIFCALFGLLRPFCYIFWGVFFDATYDQDYEMSTIIEIIGYWSIYIVGISLLSFISHYMIRTYCYLLHQDMKFINHNTPYQLVTPLLDERNNIFSQLGVSYINYISSSFEFIGCILIGFYMNYQITLCCLISIPICLLCQYWYHQNIVALRELQSSKRITTSYLFEKCIKHIKTIITYTAEMKYCSTFSNYMSSLRPQFARLYNQVGCSSGMFYFSFNFSFLITIILVYFYINNQYTVMELGLETYHCIPSSGQTIVTYCLQKVNLTNICMQRCLPINNLTLLSSSSSFGGFGMALLLVGIDVLFTVVGLFDTTNYLQHVLCSLQKHFTINGTFRTDDIPGENKQIPTDIDTLSIRLKDVSYRFNENDSSNILNNINISLQSGKFYAIAGRSGSGKTTLLKILLGLYENYKGSVCCNTIDYKSIDMKWLANQISYIPQDPRLFEGTIRENIALGASDNTVKDEDLERVAKLSGVSNFINLLPRGYDTFVGDSGTQLSLGQKQQIVLARNLLRKPRVLLVDELFYCISSPLERTIFDNFRDMCIEEHMCIVICTHSASILQSVDYVYYLNNSEIKEQGTFEQLLENHKDFSKAYNRGSLRENVSPLSNSSSSSADDEYDLSNEKGYQRKEYVMNRILKRRASTHEDLFSTLLDENDIESNQMSTSNTLLRYWNYFGSYKWLYIISLLLSLFKSLFFPMLTLMSTYFVYIFYNNFDARIQSFFSNILIILLSYGLFNYFIIWLQTWCFNTCGYYLLTKIRNEGLASYLHQEFEFFDKKQNNSFYLTSHFFSQTELVKQFFVSYLTQIVHFLFLLLISLIFHFDDHYEKICDTITDYLDNIMTIQNLHLSDNLGNSLVATCQKKVDSYAHTIIIYESIKEFLLTVFRKMTVLFLLFHGILFGETQYAVINLFFIVFLYYLGSRYFIEFSGYLSSFSSYRDALYNVLNIIDRPSEIDTRRKEGDSIQDVDGYIEFKDVNFCYTNRRSARVLNHASFTIPVGTTVGFIGNSGTGKSTIAAMLARVFQPTSGSIRIGSHNISLWNLHHLRSSVAICFNEDTIIDGSIYENIAIGQEGKGYATDSEIEEVAKITQCYHNIMKLPKQFNTIVGQNGFPLSHELRQRILLSRAIIRHPAILIIDDMLSSYDADTYTHFLTDLNDYKRRYPFTLILMGHSVNRIQLCDVIYVIDKGSIVAQGNHEFLCDNCSIYNHLCNNEINE